MVELIDAEVRVLGTLMEKEATTPEYYPLSLNALMNGCNQKSNREPVVTYDAETIEGALEGLRQKDFALFVKGSGRVDKYAQRISETMNLGRRECAILCTLFLRGPQTLGEIKDRSERMFTFGDLSEAERVLEKLAEWEDGPLVKKLARQPGQKEARYAHLFAGEPVYDPGAESAGVPPLTKVAQLEQELQGLRSELADLKARFDAFEAQWK
jgi:uncharacterized protein